MHYYYKGDNDSIRTGCGVVLKRGGEPIRATTQVDDVDCEECVRTLRTVGLIQKEPA